MLPVLLVLAQVVCPAVPAWSQGPVRLPVPFARQQKAVWCWAAVMEMVLRYKAGSSPSQCRLAEMAFGKTSGACCRGGGCRQGASLARMRALFERLGLNARLADGIAEPRQIHRMLREGAVVIARMLHTERGIVRIGPRPMGHVVVISGIRPGPGPGKPRGRGPTHGPPLLLVNDPRYPGPLEAAYPAFIRHWERSLVVE